MPAFANTGFINGGSARKGDLSAGGNTSGSPSGAGASPQQIAGPALRSGFSDGGSTNFSGPFMNTGFIGGPTFAQALAAARAATASKKEAERLAKIRSDQEGGDSGKSGDTGETGATSDASQSDTSQPTVSATPTVQYPPMDAGSPQTDAGAYGGYGQYTPNPPMPAGQGPGSLGNSVGTSGRQSVIGMASVFEGGPFEVGGLNDRHRLGADADGNPIMPLHLSTDFLLRKGQRDGPIISIRTDKDYPAQKAGVPRTRTPVWLEWDSAAKVKFRGNDLPGAWRLSAEIADTWVMVTGNSVVTADLQWSYAGYEVYRQAPVASAGYSAWAQWTGDGAIKTAGTGTIIYNTVESSNSASATGSGINPTNFPSGIKLKPLGTGVWPARKVTYSNGAVEYWITGENQPDGACA